MNVALFGGTFDPIHRGHLAVARAAAAKFRLDYVYFVPAHIPPHKLKQPITSFGHRYTMVALGTSGDSRFLPSLLESPDVIQRSGATASFTIDTIRRVRQRLTKTDNLYFLIGMDAFADISKWRSPIELLRECEFVVANRPGSSLADVAQALPVEMRPPEDAIDPYLTKESHGTLVIGGATIHLLADVNENVSSTEIRDAAGQEEGALKHLVGEPVAEYIRKLHLYPSDVAGETDGGKPRKGLHLVGGRKQGGEESSSS